MKNKFLSLAAILVGLSACTQMPGSAYFNRGEPETLLAVSTEEVNVSLEGSSGASQLAQWIDREKPSKARLVCSSNSACDRAAEVLDQYNIPYEQVDGARNMAVLSFDKVEARDCDSRFVTNHINPYNLNHRSFGCSTAVNQVQMVADKTQFTSPKLLDQYDGQKAVQNYSKYTAKEAADLNSSDFSAASVGGSK